MIHKNPVRFGVLFMSLIVALATVGVASALWSKELGFNGNVATGSVDVEIDHTVTADNEAPPVAIGDCAVTPTVDGHTQFDLSNAYPGYECWATFDVVNTGSIPVTLEQPIQVFLGLPDGTPVTDAVTIEPLAADATLPDGSVAPACYADSTLLGAGDSVACTMYFLVMDDAQQDTNYNFTYRWNAYQYTGTP